MARAWRWPWQGPAWPRGDRIFAGPWGEQANGVGPLPPRIAGAEAAHGAGGCRVATVTRSEQANPPGPATARLAVCEMRHVWMSRSTAWRCWGSALNRRSTSSRPMSLMVWSAAASRSATSPPGSGPGEGPGPAPSLSRLKAKLRRKSAVAGPMPRSPSTSPDSRCARRTCGRQASPGAGPSHRRREPSIQTRQAWRRAASNAGRCPRASARRSVSASPAPSAGTAPVTSARSQASASGVQPRAAASNSTSRGDHVGLPASRQLPADTAQACNACAAGQRRCGGRV